MSYIWTAFSLGLLGSLHCAGMCGPICLVLGKRSDGTVWRTALLYNLGRVATYAVLGLFIGLVGKGIWLAGLQRYFSILAAVFLLVMAFRLPALERLLVSDRFPLSAFYKEMQRQLGGRLGASAGMAPLLAGGLNGLLPCGLVYVALAGAVGTENIGQSIGYMALFGAGTLPMMLSVTVLGMRWQWRSAYRKLFPLVLSFLALLLLMRGLNFRLPDNFFFREKLMEMPMCH